MAITFAPNINTTQQAGINSLVQSGRAFNETDAKNYAYATGSKDFSQYVGKTGSQITMPQSFDASTLGTGATFNTTTPTPAANPSDFVNRINAGIGAADKIYQEGITKAQTQLEPFQKEQTNLVDRIKNLMGTRTNTTDFYNQQLQQQGVPETQKALNDLNIQIANRTADFNNAIARIPGQGIGLTTGAVQGLTERERRISAVELGNLGILKIAYQGNIDAATQTAKDLVDFKYKDEKAAIDDQLALLQLNYDQMSTAEKRVAEQQAVLLQDRQARIDEAKAESTAIANAAIQAANNKAPASIAQKMQQAKSLQEALAIGGQYLATPEKAETPNIQVIGQDEYGNNVYGYYDTNKGGVVSVNGGNLGSTDPSQGIVGGFNIGVYATDPNHEKAVASILNNIGQFQTLEDVDQYIQNNAPGSPITSAMISAASQKYGVPWEMMVAMMQQDSSLGTKGKGARTFNPGNVGNDDSGNIRNYGNWQAGVDAVGNWLNKHRVDATQNTETANQSKTIKDAFNSISVRLSSDQRKSSGATLDRLLADGKIEEAKQSVIATAIAGLPTEQQNKALGRVQAIDALENVQSLLDKFVQAGGDTGLLKGKVEDLAQRVGETSNSNLANIGNQIQLAIQAYRNAVSGAAFTESEKQQYDKVFPSVGKSPELNNILISSLIDTFELNQKSIFKTIMGENNFNALFDTNVDLSSFDKPTNSGVTGKW